MRKFLLLRSSLGTARLCQSIFLFDNSNDIKFSVGFTDRGRVERLGGGVGWTHFPGSIAAARCESTASFIVGAVAIIVVWVPVSPALAWLFLAFHFFRHLKTLLSGLLHNTYSLVFYWRLFLGHRTFAFNLKNE
jgi:hypothetical protein